jgi:hypothetical protein
MDSLAFGLRMPTMIRSALGFFDLQMRKASPVQGRFGSGGVSAWLLVKSIANSTARTIIKPIWRAVELMVAIVTSSVSIRFGRIDDRNMRWPSVSECDVTHIRRDAHLKRRDGCRLMMALRFGLGIAPIAPVLTCPAKRWRRDQDRAASLP